MNLYICIEYLLNDITKISIQLTYKTIVNNFHVLSHFHQHSFIIFLYYDRFLFFLIVILIFQIFQNIYFTHTMRKDEIHTPKTMRKYLHYAYYGEKFFPQSKIW